MMILVGAPSTEMSVIKEDKLMRTTCVVLCSTESKVNQW